MHFSLSTALLATAVAFGSISHAAKCKGFRTYEGSNGFIVILPSLSNSQSSSIDCTLSNGDRYDGVEWLQKQLNKCNFNVGAADGIFGDDTEAGVRSVQRKAEITVDGIYGPNTRKAMKWNAAGCRAWSAL